MKVTTIAFEVAQACAEADPDQPTPHSQPSNCLSQQDGSRQILILLEKTAQSSHSYQNTYKHPQLPRSHSQVSPLMQAAILKTTPFEGMSEYKNMYKASRAELHDQSRPAQSHRINASVIPQHKFQGSSSYKDSYKMPETVNAINYQVNRTPFEGVSSYKNDFLKPAHIPAPTDRYLHSIPSTSRFLSPSNTPFQAMTSYKHDYIKPEPGQVEPAGLSVQDIPRTNSKFEGQTSYSHYQKRGMQHSQEDEPCPCIRMKLPSINYTQKELDKRLFG